MTLKGSAIRPRPFRWIVSMMKEMSLGQLRLIFDGMELVGEA